jgi:hypothetical protein
VAKFPYTPMTGKLKGFLQKIQQVSRPDIVDKEWLASIGFGASNDRRIIPILKFIGFVDQSGKSTETWPAYRDKSRSKKILADGIRQGYAELFETYPDAYRRNDEDVANFFTARANVAAQVVSITVKTFKTLCELAEFGDVPVADSEVSVPSDNTGTGRSAIRTVAQGLGPSITININIQLTLPDKADEAEYDKFFAALKKHLLPG